MSATSKMLLNMDVAHHQTLLLVTSSVEEQTRSNKSLIKHTIKKDRLTEAKDLEIRGYMCVPHRHTTCNQADER